MAKYTIVDFTKGDQVYHLSNTNLRMVVVEISKEMNELTCRWVDKAGKTQSAEFMPEELGKSSDLNPRVFSW